MAPIFHHHDHPHHGHCIDSKQPPHHNHERRAVTSWVSWDLVTERLLIWRVPLTHHPIVKMTCSPFLYDIIIAIFPVLTMMLLLKCWLGFPFCGRGRAPAPKLIRSKSLSLDIHPIHSLIRFVLFHSVLVIFNFFF